MMSGDYAPSFAVDGVVKDLGLIRDAARASSVDDRMLTTVLQLFEDASDDGHGGDDMAAVRTAF